MRTRNTLTRRLKVLALRTGAAPSSAATAGRRGGCFVRVANDLESRRAAYRLVYELYLEKEYAAPNAARMWVSGFDALPTTTTFLAVSSEGDRPLGAVTVVCDSPARLPADSIYGPELDALRASGRRLCEIVSLAVDPRAEGGSRVLVQLFNHVYLLARRIHGATDLVITVNPRHVGFYRKAMLFREAGPERDYAKVGGAPALLMRLDLALAEEQTRLEHKPAGLRISRPRTLYRFFCPPEREQGIARKMASALRPMSEAEMAYFLPHRCDRTGGTARVGAARLR